MSLTRQILLNNSGLFYEKVYQEKKLRRLKHKMDLKKKIINSARRAGWAGDFRIGGMIKTAYLLAY